jgi:Rod binding domain-containing protein
VITPSTGIGLRDDVRKAAHGEIPPPQEPNPAEKGLKKLSGVARTFESFFVGLLMKSMRQTIKKSGFLSGGRGEEMFTGMLDQQWSESAADQGKGIGIAKMIIDRYTRHVRVVEGPDGNAVDRQA